ncbi:unnamed protein product [Parascedosporium putredinis]|uniref:Peroxin 26 n=1 Tax=Parascedosporium putredinis TaxID=1442378 RepID=A0A9P1GWA9_9PEZI|nr:unnamed protein product [Parascedosporium putredinis]CAI7988671.1 unnamed protein product [Parascedosporium putredinis]
MPSNGSAYSATLSPTTTAVTPTADGFPPHVLSSSISSMASARTSKRTSPITKTYHQASTLFLTRRLPEALTTLLPLITTPQPADQNGANGSMELAPVARAPRNTRIKVWSLYLTILNAVLELDPDEGKDMFGTQEWRALCNKVRDGLVWEEVVRNGYHGVEGDVDSDVVINLATLLLAHARTQGLNQKRLESYLATCNSPNLDLTQRLNSGSRPSYRYMSPARGAVSGADTPRDLNARVKILELYTLHVLLRNNEWEYAREFISVSSVLDEERREAFLQALQSLQEEQQEADRLEREERERQQEELKRDIEEARRLRAENEKMEQRRLQEEKERKAASAASEAAKQPKGLAIQRQQGPPRPRLSTAPLTLGDRANLMMQRLQGVIEHLSSTFSTNPVFLMRLMAFVLGIIFMFSSRAIREKVQRIINGAWGKVRQTAGMGVKVSYM